MAATKAPRAKAGGRATKQPAQEPQETEEATFELPTLPPITVAKFEETGRLLERTAAENQALFVQAGQEYKEQHRQGSSRPLTALEAAHIAAAMSDPTNERAEQIQQSSLRAYDDPGTTEMLLAAGVRTAPALVEAFREVVALVEMPSDAFRDACENGTLPDAIRDAAEPLRWIELPEAKARTAAVGAHYARSAGFEPGEALGLPVQALWQALKGAVTNLISEADSASSRLIDSAASTTGPSSTSSTD